MRYLKLYEAFKSEVLSKTLSFVSPDTKRIFIEKVEAICKSIDFPMSELSDDFFQRMSFSKALELFVDEGHQAGKIKWVKFWFEKDGKYITSTGVDGSTVKIGKKESLEDYEIVKTLSLREIVEELQTGDKVYIKLESDCDPVIATVFREYDEEDEFEKVYMIQNRHNGSKPGSTEWQNYGSYSWVIGGREDFYGTPQLLERKPDVIEDGKEKNPYEYNFVVNTYGRLSLRKGESNETEKYLRSASFALVLDFEALQTSKYKTKSSIESERSELRSGALAFMTDEEIKSKNLERYFSEVAKKIKFNEDLSNIKNSLIKLLGGNRMFMTVFKGQFYPVQRFVQEVYSLIRLLQMDSQDEYVKDMIKNTIWQIESNIKETYEQYLKRNTANEKMISDFKKHLVSSELKSQFRDYETKVNLISEITVKFEKLVNDFTNVFRNLKIETLDDVEIMYYKLLGAFKFANESQRFYTLKSAVNTFIEYRDAEGLAHRLFGYDIQPLEEINQQITQFTPLVLKLLQ